MPVQGSKMQQFAYLIVASEGYNVFIDLLAYLNAILATVTVPDSAKWLLPALSTHIITQH